MSLRYRDVLRDRVVDMPEPQEVQAAEADEYRGKWLAMHQRRTIQRMDDSKRWQRVTDEPSSKPEPQASPAPAEAEAEPTPYESERGDRPAINDPKDVWVDWAVVEHGYDREEAKTLTKEQLREL